MYDCYYYKSYPNDNIISSSSIIIICDVPNKEMNM